MKMVIPKDYLERGCFSVPHFIFCEHTALSPYEKHFLVTLMAVENEYHAPGEQGWFHMTNEGFHERSGISLTSIPKIRERLHQKDLLRYRKGYSGRSTEYLILLDTFYRWFSFSRESETSTPLKASS
jgi:hypothetical protein